MKVKSLHLACLEQASGMVGQVAWWRVLAMADTINRWSSTAAVPCLGRPACNRVEISDGQLTNKF